MSSTLKPNQKIGAWTLLSHTPATPKNATPRVGAMWRCRCDCGTLRNVRQDNIASGQSRSCGCVGAVKKSLDMGAAFSGTTQRRAML